MNKKKIEKFLNLLEQACNFKQKEKGKPESITWECDNSIERPQARKVLQDMKVPANEIEEIMDICEHNGGYCDCEILFNAEEALLKHYK